MAKFFNSKIIFLSLFFILYSAEKNPSHAQIAVSLSADKTTICSGERIKFNVTPYAIDYEYYLIDDINNVIDYNLSGNNLFEKKFENNSSTPISIIISSRIKYDLLGVKFFVDSPPLTNIVNPTPWEAEYDNTLKYNFTKLDDAISLNPYLKNIGKLKPPAKPTMLPTAVDLQTFNGTWSGDGGKYEFSFDGRKHKLEATVEEDRLTITGDAFPMIFEREY